MQRGSVVLDVWVNDPEIQPGLIDPGCRVALRTL